MDITIICPLYNAEGYIENLNNKILNQKIDEEDSLEVIYVLTESKDDTLKYLKKNNLKYEIVKFDEFSHSFTREKMALKYGKDIIVFISQDIEPKNDIWLKMLTDSIKNEKCEASFSRQLCKYNNIEKYTREYNYKEKSRIVSKNDLDELGLYTFFYSDASSAIKGEVYRKLHAYDGKKLLISEDMYLAEKIIMNGYRIKYCSTSEVYHSHNFKLKDLFKRYFDTGVFFKTNSQFDGYSGNNNGIAMVKYIIKRSIQDRNIKVLLRILPDFGARFIGSNLGKRYKLLGKGLINKFTLNKSYWKENYITRGSK